MTSYQFKSPQMQESPCQLVTIGNVDVYHQIAAATGISGGGNYVITLSVFNAPILTWPKSGEQWYIHLVKGQWVLRERSSISAQAYLVDAVPGDQIQDVQGNLTIQSTGTISITDSNEWNPVNYENSWSDYAGGYPVAEYLVFLGQVRFRGAIKAGTQTDATLAFTIPPQYAPPAGELVFPTALVPGATGTPATSGMRLAVNTVGSCFIYGVGTASAMSIDSVSYFYKF
jgi:hypothetical protein